MSYATFIRKYEGWIMISAKLTFYGLCKEAIVFYSQCFEVRLMAKKRFQDAKDAFPQGIDAKYHDFIFSAELEITLEGDRFHMTMGDSPMLVFTGADEISGCKDNIAFDIRIRDPEVMKGLYDQFINAGSKTNIPLAQTEQGELRCSLIDPYGICWTMFCGAGKDILE